MKIGIIGAGWLGATVGRAWVKAGHQVLFSSRHPDKQQRAAAALGPLASGGTIAEAAAFGKVVLIALPYRARGTGTGSAGFARRQGRCWTPATPTALIPQR